MEIIVSYQHRDMRQEAERECATWKEAIRVADGCIEDGGHADISVYLEEEDTLDVTIKSVLATCYFYNAQGEAIATL